VSIRDEANVVTPTKVSIHGKSALSDELTASGAGFSDVGGYYPERAYNLGREGDATVRCKMTASRQFSDCAVVTEDPSGFGFGSASLKIVDKVKLKDGAAAKPDANGVVVLLFDFRAK
jgi:hypothetical protein